MYDITLMKEIIDETRTDESNSPPTHGRPQYQEQGYIYKKKKGTTVNRLALDQPFLQALYYPRKIKPSLQLNHLDRTFTGHLIIPFPSLVVPPPFLSSPRLN